MNFRQGTESQELALIASDLRVARLGCGDFLSLLVTVENGWCTAAMAIGERRSTGGGRCQGISRHLLPQYSMRKFSFGDANCESIWHQLVPSQLLLCRGSHCDVPTQCQMISKFAWQNGSSHTVCFAPEAHKDGVHWVCQSLDSGGKEAKVSSRNVEAMTKAMPMKAKGCMSLNGTWFDSLRLVICSW